jgi:rhamnulokinase
MTSAIVQYCQDTAQRVPGNVGEFVRLLVESLALAYRYALGQLECVKGKKLRKIHIVGGGSKNGFLCQCAADATGLPVYAGPAEATAIGNVLLQAMASDEIRSLEEMREVIIRSFPVDVYEPKPNAYWDMLYERFRKVRLTSLLIGTKQEPAGE